MRCILPIVSIACAAYFEILAASISLISSVADSIRNPCESSFKSQNSYALTVKFWLLEDSDFSDVNVVKGIDVVAPFFNITPNAVRNPEGRKNKWSSPILYTCKHNTPSSFHDIVAHSCNTASSTPTHLQLVDDLLQIDLIDLSLHNFNHAPSDDLALRALRVRRLLDLVGLPLGEANAEDTEKESVGGLDVYVCLDERLAWCRRKRLGNKWFVYRPERKHIISM